MLTAKIWRETPQRYRLEAGKCKNCGKVFFPPRLICDACRTRKFETINLPWQGTLLAYTIIHTPPAAFNDEAPYAVGIVELQPGVKLTCQIVDIDFSELKIGQKVAMEFRCIQKNEHRGVLAYGYKAVPINKRNMCE